jgi:hypothetical protein
MKNLRNQNSTNVLLSKRLPLFCHILFCGVVARRCRFRANHTLAVDSESSASELELQLLRRVVPSLV